MDKEQAKAYLKRKNKDLTDENIEAVVKKGKIYGDPIVELD